MHIASCATSMIRPATARVARPAARVGRLIHGRHGSGSRRPGARPEPEREHHRDTRARERQHARVELERELDGRDHDGKLLEGQRGRPAREQQADEPRQEREHHAFSGQLPDQPPASAAEGQANDELSEPALRPGEHQVREVGARHQEHERRDARQNHQRPGVASALGGITGRGSQEGDGLAPIAHDVRVALSELGRLLREEALSNEGRGGRGLLDAHAGSSRPMTISQRAPVPQRSSSRPGVSGISAGCIVSGIQTSDGCPTECPVNPFRATPTTS